MADIDGSTPATPKPTAAVPPPTKTESVPAAEPKKEASPKEPNSSGWDAETKAYIGTLRSENATWRKKTKGLETQVNDLSEKWSTVEKVFTGKEEDPQKALTNLQTDHEQLVVKNAILEAGIEYQIPKAQMDYFGYRIQNAANELAEGEDLGPEELTQIANEVKAISTAGGNGAGNGGATTGVATGKTPTPQGSHELTVDEFKKMGLLEKSRLQQEKPELYSEMKKQATSII